MEPSSNKPIFNPNLFWDINFSKIDYKTEADFIIERVFESGDIDDIRHCRRYYGDEMIKPVLLSAKGLSKMSLYLAAAVLDEPVINFSSYKILQSLWIFDIY